MNDFELMLWSLERRRGGVICLPFPSHLRRIVRVEGLASKAERSFSASLPRGGLVDPSPRPRLMRFSTASGHAHPGSTAPSRPGNVAQKYRRGKKAIAYVHCVLGEGVLSVSARREERCNTHRQTHLLGKYGSVHAHQDGVFVRSTTHRFSAQCTVLASFNAYIHTYMQNKIKTRDYPPSRTPPQTKQLRSPQRYFP